MTGPTWLLSDNGDCSAVVAELPYNHVDAFVSPINRRYPTQWFVAMIAVYPTAGRVVPMGVTYHASFEAAIAAAELWGRELCAACDVPAPSASPTYVAA